MAATSPPTRETNNNPNKTIFLLTITLTQLVQSIPLGAGINAGLAIASSLSSPSPAASAWVVASYPLTQGAFVLIGGRLGEVHGHKTILALGSLWWVIWAFAGGYATNLVGVCLMRGLCGIGGGLMAPNVVALIGVSFPPGKGRNLGMALFGAMAPVGAAGGSLVAAVVVQLAGWRWLFFML
jgi:MFS family permease